MRVVVLSSGSKGNTTFVETENHKILIDFGMNTKYTKDNLEKLNKDINQIDYIFLSHTHKDHVGGLEIFLHKYQPYVCLSEKMFEDLPYLKDYDKTVIYNDKIILSDVEITLFKTSHDTDSRGFVFESNNKSFVFVTDTGYINSKYFKLLANKELYIIESNHDPEKLRYSKYPLWLQNRILSDYGHLSNKMTGFYLSKLIGNRTKKVILAHLSEENNSTSLALGTVKSILKENNIELIDIIVAKQSEMLDEVIL